MEQYLNMKNRQFKNMLLIFIALSLVIGCKESRETALPVTREEALLRSDVRLPLPVSAEKVMYRLRGKTQDWDLYLYYAAPIKDIENLILSELSIYSKVSQVSGKFEIEKYNPKSISDVIISKSILKNAPKWWTPHSISMGYFIGSSSALGYGPRFWVDTKNSKVFFYQHF